MVRFVILLLFKLVALISSEYSERLVFQMSDIYANTHQMERTLLAYQRFTLMIYSEKSLINYLLYCNDKENPHQIFINGMNFIELHEEPYRAFALKKYLETSLSMQAYWECTLKSNLSDIVTIFDFQVQVIRPAKIFGQMPLLAAQQKGNEYDSHSYSPTMQNQGYGYGQLNNKIMPIRQEAATGNEIDINKQGMQTEPPNQEKKDTSNLSTNTLIVIIAVIALLQTFLIAGYFLRKRLCGRKQSVEEPGRREERSSEPEYEDLDSRTAVMNRPPYPLPPQEREENKTYLHYNVPYDHRIIRPPTRQSGKGQLLTTRRFE